LSETIRVKELKPFPEPLPEGEHVLWQHSPTWRPYARRVFQLDRIALYFLFIVAWVGLSAFFNGGMVALLKAMSWSIPPALGVLLILASIAWLYARTSVYTITNKRIVIQSGLAFETFTNLPFSKVSSADLKTFKDGTGDIELTITGHRLLYSMLWPNVRLLRLKRPVPMMRALQQPHQVAETLGRALSNDQPGEAISKQDKQALDHGMPTNATS